MITNGFTYIAVLVFIAALLVWLQRYTKSKFFDYAPPIVLLYLITMILCTLGAWDMEATKPAYSVLKNNLLYAMIFLMLLRCDIRKIIKLGPKMLGGFFAASVSISLAFIATFAIMKGPLGSEAWKALGALCGSWMGGSGNMIAVQAALDIGEADMAYALVVDSIDYSIWVMFLLWAINLAPKFNKWVKADTTTLDEVSRRLEEDAKGNEDKASFVNLIFLLGLALVISAFGQDIGAALNGAMPFLDKATWTVLLITLSGLIGAVTPVGRMAGSTELSNLLLYSVVALLASRASFLELTDAPAWILAGFMILAIHGIILVLLAKIFHLDMFTCGVASLANIGGSASAPILAGAYSGALVPVGVLMALMGYVIGCCMCNSPFFYTIFCLAAQICAAHALVGQQFSTGALHDHTARLKDVGTVCHGKSHLCVLLHQQDGHAFLVHVLDDVEDLLHQQRRKAHGRLVQHQHGSVAHQCTAHSQHLLLAAGHGTGQLLAALLQAGEQLKHLFLVGCNGGSRLGVCTHVQIFFHGHVQEHMTAFRHMGKACFHDLVGAHALDAAALVQDVAGLGLQQAGNGLQGGGFASTVGTDQGDDLALIHLEGDVLDGVDVAVIDVDVINFQ